MIDIKEEVLPISTLDNEPQGSEGSAFEILNALLENLNRKVVVLDDDPTGVQAVHDIPVYTDWFPKTLEQAFLEEGSMFFILTNSRSLTKEQTVVIHKEMAENIYAASKKSGKDFIIISRSDSTLRGHYPIETETLRDAFKKYDIQFDGEIIYPFFKEGGRLTVENIHYVKDGDNLIPAAETEFAKDKVFGYHHSYLPNWCEEKTEGKYKAEDVVCISLDDLRKNNTDVITSQLQSVTDFEKIIVNSTEYSDVAVFIAAFIKATLNGKRFMFRSAAAVTKVLGGVSDQPLLTRDQLISSKQGQAEGADGQYGGIVLVGSYVNKTTKQLESLQNSDLPLTYIEFDVQMALKENGLIEESDRVRKALAAEIMQGRSVAIYTSRTYLDMSEQSKEMQLELSVNISTALTNIIEKLTVKPSFIIAKGGITSSDIGTKALHVRRAMVMGQVSPGIPVWLTDADSKFGNMPFIIFPGNVGDEDTLKNVVEMLIKEKV